MYILIRKSETGYVFQNNGKKLKRNKMASAIMHK